MSSVKFECPVCNQHIECERACSGDVIHCPGCGAQIRVPFHQPSEVDGSFSRAELVAPATPATHALDASFAEAHHKTEKREATVNCPACHAELNVVMPENGGGPSATVLHPPPAAAREPLSTATDTPKSEHPDFAHMSLEERERQIARAREAHPIQVNSNPKPRLEYVLEGKAPSPTTRNE